MLDFEISAAEAAELLKENKARFIDVREPFEWDICRIPGATLIPLGQLPSRMSELDSAHYQTKSKYAQHNQRNTENGRLRHPWRHLDSNTMRARVRVNLD